MESQLNASGFPCICDVQVFPLEQLVVVPDSSLRSRTFPQAKEALSNMVQVRHNTHIFIF